MPKFQDIIMMVKKLPQQIPALLRCLTGQENAECDFEPFPA